MNKKASIYETGFVMNGDEKQLVFTVVITHRRHVVHEYTMRCAWDVEPDEIGFRVMQEFDAQEFYYYYSFHLPVMEKSWMYYRELE